MKTDKLDSCNNQGQSNGVLLTEYYFTLELYPKKTYLKYVV